MIYLDESSVKALLNWDDTFKATEVAMKSVSQKKAVISKRIFSQIFNTPKWMLSMPGYLEDDTFGGWACKVLSGNPNNEKLADPSVPNLSVNIMLMDINTGVLKAVIAGIELTNYRTAAASAVATQYLYVNASKPQKILAVLGVGDQGRAHAEAFHHYFKFEEIRLWNRTSEKARLLAKSLNDKFNTTKFKHVLTTEAGVRGADVIIAATSPGNVPLVKYEWVKKGAHINAIGVTSSNSNTNEKLYELDEDVYKNSTVYVDNWVTANTELTALKDLGTDIRAEIGDLILGNLSAPGKEQLTVFQSLGMAIEDCAMARLIFDTYTKKNNF